MSIYVHDRPVAGTVNFVGKDLLQRSVLSGVERKRSFVLCGGPKTGRTSILQSLRGKMRERWVRNPQSTTLVPVYLDVQPLAGGGLATVLTGLWQAIADGLTDPRLHRQTMPIGRISFKAGEDAWTSFMSESQNLAQSLTGTAAWCEYVLLLDNAHALLGASLPRFEGFLRMLACNFAAWKPAAVVAAGGRLLREHLLDDLEVGKAMRPLVLGNLNRSEAESLIRLGGMPLEPEDIASLVMHTGRHPFTLQRVLAEVAKQGGHINIETAMDYAYADIAPLMQRFWDELDLGRDLTYRGAYAAPEHALMQYMIESSKPIIIKKAERHLSLRPLKEYAELLEYVGLAERSLRGDMPEWRANFELWNAWYLDRIGR